MKRRARGIIVGLVAGASVLGAVGRAHADEPNAPNDETRLEIDGEAAGVDLRVDGQCALEERSGAPLCTPLDGPTAFRVEPGLHELRVRRAGFAMRLQTVDVPSGASVHVLVTLDDPSRRPERNPYVEPMAIAWAVAATALLIGGFTSVRLATSADDDPGRRDVLTTVRAVSLVGAAVAAGVAAYSTVGAVRWRPSRALVVDAGGDGTAFGLRLLATF